MNTKHIFYFTILASITWSQVGLCSHQQDNPWNYPHPSAAPSAPAIETQASVNPNETGQRATPEQASWSDVPYGGESFRPKPLLATAQPRLPEYTTWSDVPYVSQTFKPKPLLATNELKSEKAAPPPTGFLPPRRPMATELPEPATRHSASAAPSAPSTPILIEVVTPREFDSIPSFMDELQSNPALPFVVRERLVQELNKNVLQTGDTLPLFLKKMNNKYRRLLREHAR